MCSSMRLSLFAIAHLVLSLSSCGKTISQEGEGKVGGEVLTNISCKNEALVKLWDAHATLDQRSFGFGLVGINKKASIVAGNLPKVKSVTIAYSMYPKDGDPKNLIEKKMEYREDKLAAVTAAAGEVEVVCQGDEKWLIRVYERSPDHNGKIILEEKMKLVQKE